MNGHPWNIHGGLLPWYRGCLTHFRPNYCTEPYGNRIVDRYSDGRFRRREPKLIRQF